MAEGEKKGEGEGEKGGEGGEKKDAAQQRIDAEVARRHKAEKELSDLKKAQADKDTESLKTQNQFKELYEKSEPRAKLADELEKSVGEYFGEEIEGLSDEQKALIPEGALHTKLAWVKKAKKAGIFGKQNTPDKTFNGKPKGGLPPDKWYLGLEDGDERVGTLPSAQYLERKAYRKTLSGEPVKVRGGF